MLEGKTVLITGASSGIGRATAKIIAAYGANVVIAARREDESLEVIADIEEAGGTASFIKTDVTLEADIEAAVSHAVATYGRLDCAANNAGGGFGSSEWSEATPDILDKTFEVNVRGMWLCMKHEIAQMRKQGNGSIVNTSSIVGMRASPGEAYGSSKYAVNGLTSSAAAKYGKSGIRVNSVAPGIINAGGWKPRFEADPDLWEAWSGAIPAGRPGNPEEVGEAIAWLCSDASSYVTGAILPVDGGNAITINSP